jgi:hypothetical protein
MHVAIMFAYYKQEFTVPFSIPRSGKLCLCISSQRENCKLLVHAIF